MRRSLLAAALIPLVLSSPAGARASDDGRDPVESIGDILQIALPAGDRVSFNVPFLAVAASW